MLAIRDARESDYEAFSALFPELAVPDPVPSPDKWRDVFAPRTIIAERAGVVVGYCFYETLTETGYIRNVVSSRAARRTGVGRALVAAAADRFRASGCTKICLNVKPDNTAAVELYKSFGMAFKYESTAMGIAWSDVDALPTQAAVVSASPMHDAAAEERFSMPRGQLESHRPLRKVLFLLDVDDGAVVAVAAFDPTFPGAFPFRLATAAYARPLFDAMREHKRPADTHVNFVVEDGRSIVQTLQRAGATIRLEIAHYEGPL